MNSLRQFEKEQVTPENNDGHGEFVAMSSESVSSEANLVAAAKEELAAECSSCFPSEERLSSGQEKEQHKCRGESRSHRSSTDGSRHRRHHHHSHSQSPYREKGRRSRSPSSPSSLRKPHGRRRRDVRNEGRRSHSGSKSGNGQPRKRSEGRSDRNRPERRQVCAEDLMQQVQERKKLWQSNKEKKVSSQWKQVISSCSSGQTADKFRKLMGIKGDEIVGNDPMHAQTNQRDNSSHVMETLDRQYAEARILTHTCRGMGLGYSWGR
uniref:SMAP domain-containing protein n=1 Tax=Trichuris muris TaxID=70415 RepID=A0A5S6QF83_TRIMR